MSYYDDGDEQKKQVTLPPPAPYGTQPNHAQLGPAIPPPASTGAPSPNLDWKNMLQALLQKRQQQQAPGTGLSVPSPSAGPQGQLGTASQIGSLGGSLAKRFLGF